MRAAFRLLVVLAPLVLVTTSCDGPTAVAPEEARPRDLVTASDLDAGSEVGCGTLSVSLEGRNEIVTAVTEPCGTLRLLVGPGAEFDRSAGKVRLPLQVESSGNASLDTKAYVAVWPDSLRVLRPPGLASNRHTADYLGVSSPDSVVADDAAELPGAHLWILPEDQEAPEGTVRFGPRWVELSVHDGVLSFEARFWLKVEHAAAVPETPPDFLPSDLWDTEDPLWGAPTDIVVVGFGPGTSPTEKAAAIAMVEGTVVGGVPFANDEVLEGFYVVRIPSEGVLESAIPAADRLQALPYVAGAAIALRVSGFSRKPDDGAGWTGWTARPDSATIGAPRWALEQISAPLAWGCETGRREPRIAVVDYGHYPASDIAPNLRTSVTSNASRDSMHGTWVTSVLAAEGDNQSGMTGVLWSAGVTPYEVPTYSPTPAIPSTLNNYTVAAALQAAAHGGEQVINISLGVPPSGNAGPDSARAEHLVRLMMAGLRFLPTGVERPLIVAAAGDSATDAYFSGIPILRDTFPQNVLVVAATREQRTAADGGVPLIPRSNTGDLVEIAAPGEVVAALDWDGTAVSATGSSIAAPFVTGVAGLLLSFDPEIPLNGLKHLILTGARNGGREGRGSGHAYPLLNAYEALKAAARRPGAPLCGSRLAADGAELYVERESGWEHILDLGGDFGDLNPLHGGRTIDTYVFDLTTGTSGHDRFELQAGGWTRTGPAPSIPHGGPSDGPMNNSLRGRSHSADTTAHLRQLHSSSSRDFGVRIYESTNHANVYYDHTIHEPYDFTSNIACVVRFGESCRRFVGLYEGDVIRPGPSPSPVAWVPQGGKVVVWFVRGTRTGSLGGWYGCGDDHVCRNDEYFVDRNRTDFYEVDVTTGDRRALFSIPYAAEAVGVSEDGREIMVARYLETFESLTWYETYTNSWGDLRPEPHDSSRREDTECSVEWYDYETGDVLATAPFSKTCRINEDLGDHVQDTYDWFIGSMSP